MTSINSTSIDLTAAIDTAVTCIAGNDARSMATTAVTAAAPLIEQAVRTRIKEENKHWNEALDWLLNSRHTGDPDIQAAFWLLAAGRCTREEADRGHTDDDRSVLSVYNELDERGEL
jgi:hypothetical protein